MSAHHDTHGQHPAGVGAFVLMLVAFAALAITLVAFAGGHTVLGIIAAVVTVVGFGVTAVMMTTMGRKLHHSALVPDYTDTDKRHYQRDYRS
ncbi:hypothetical protein [Gordonia sp. NPDC003950]